MIIASDKGGGDFQKVSQGPVQAVCYDVWDIGIQKGEWMGKEKIAHKVIIGFEVDELVSSGPSKGKRLIINQFFTLSLRKGSNLKAMLEGWLGELTPHQLKAFDLEKLIGMNCILNIVHKDDKAKIKSVAPIMKSMMPFKPENKRSIPEWVQDFADKQLNPGSVTATSEPDESPTEEGDASFPPAEVIE